jgi:uncharacterized protein YjgD (DUF1641 family)
VALHKWISYGTASLMAIHLLLHLRHLDTVGKKVFAELKTPVVRRTLNNTAAIVLVTAMIYVNLSRAIESWMFQNAIAVDEIGRSESESESDYATRRKAEKAQSNIDTINSLAESGSKTSMTEFLGKMYCTACYMYCPLTFLRCGEGRSYLDAAKELYSQIIAESK